MPRRGWEPGLEPGLVPGLVFYCPSHLRHSSFTCCTGLWGLKGQRTEHSTHPQVVNKR